jgi:hypothetical protein
MSVALRSSRSIAYRNLQLFLFFFLPTALHLFSSERNHAWTEKRGHSGFSSDVSLSLMRRSLQDLHSFSRTVAYEYTPPKMTKIHSRHKSAGICQPVSTTLSRLQSLSLFFLQSEISVAQNNTTSLGSYWSSLDVALAQLRRHLAACLSISLHASRKTIDSKSP